MNFIRGEIFDNKTNKYLKPILNDGAYYPTYLKNYLLKNYCGCFIADLQYSELFPDQYLLFIVVDINGEYVDKMQQYRSIERGRRDYKEFLKQWQTKKVGGYKVYDYVWGDLDKSHRHVFVLNIENYKEAKDYFDKGQYSKMFNQAELKKLNITKTKGGKLSRLYATFTKSESAKQLFKERVEKEFGTVLNDVEVEQVDEFDTPPLKRNEVLNSKVDAEKRKEDSFKS